jgi:hypothetical protein
LHLELFSDLFSFLHLDLNGPRLRLLLFCLLVLAILPGGTSTPRGLLREEILLSIQIGEDETQVILEEGEQGGDHCAKFVFQQQGCLLQ